MPDDERREVARTVEAAKEAFPDWKRGPPGIAPPARMALLLVDDVDQCPSVGSGPVLGDIIGSGAVTVVRLIFRMTVS